MTTRAAEELIRELVQDFAPVRPIPPLPSVLAAAVALGLVAVAGHWLLGGPGLRPGGSAVSSLSYAATLAGLVLVALGALGAALASPVPGREATARLGARVAAVGMLLALGGGLWGISAAGVLMDGERIADCLSCIGRALTLGAAPVLVACSFIAYAAVRRPGAGTALALAGGVAFGAAAVHATCPIDSPVHWLLAHILAPVAAVAVLTVPLAAWVTRRTPA